MTTSQRTLLYNRKDADGAVQSFHLEKQTIAKQSNVGWFRIS
jgi:hypothetical protein